MQQELLPMPPSNETEEVLKARIERLYKTYGQNWRPFFEQKDDRVTDSDEPDPMPWWLLRQARQLAAAIPGKE
jgi:hypothetical protein